MTLVIGGDNQLNVIISSYKPNFKCNQDPAAPWATVVLIFAHMLASKNQQIFGREGAPEVDVPLPYQIKSCMYGLDDQILLT